MDETSYIKIFKYIDHNPAAVLGTIGEDGPHGSVIYVVTATGRTVCFVTKDQSRKYHNLTAHPQVCLTFLNEKEGTTLQASGKAFVADDPGLREMILDRVAKMHATMSGWIAPVTKLADGQYVVIGVDLTYATLTEYQDSGIGGPIITQLN
ncbi:MAG TPA: pyridoxamine 5'-phosphate oxidase family protein [Bacillota bacterium]|nr:pyridoxamine 5'-phosphate oxidase family protein [Bacillota bacterium]